MGRPRSGKDTVTETRVKRPNGDTYVYERRLQYDPETRRMRDVGWKLKGKIPAGGADIVPTRPRRRKDGQAGPGCLPASDATRNLAQEAMGQVTGQAAAASGRARAMDIAVWACRASGVHDDLRVALPPREADTVESVALYWLMSDCAALERMASWQAARAAPGVERVPRDVYIPFVRVLGAGENGLLEFAARRARRAGGGKVLALDVAGASPRGGRGGESAGRLLALVGGNGAIPLCLMPQPRGVAPWRAARAALELSSLSHADLAPENVLLVTGGGPLPPAAVGLLARGGMPFLAPMDCGAGWGRACVGLCREREASLAATGDTSFDMTLVRRVDIDESGEGVCAPADTLSEPPAEGRVRRVLHVHVAFSRELRAQDAAVFHAELSDLRRAVEAGFPLTARAREEADRLLETSGDGDGRAGIGVRSEACAREASSFGYRVLVGDGTPAGATAWELARLRDVLETRLACGADAGETWLRDPVARRGWLFCRLVAVSLELFLARRLAEVKASLRGGRLRAGDPEEQDRRALAAWLDPLTVPGLLDWFDGAERPSAATRDRAGRRSESMARLESLFLRELGLEAGNRPLFPGRR